ncbi:MAG: ATP-binding protein [Gammaproteobacteria bacterium]|nr:ATP-binding protein [Gammaproteobacteria bacterium]
MKTNRLPYPGLRPFKREETNIFFGREEHADELLARLGKTRFLAVIGASGCGKSSLVRAGLLAGLDIGFLAQAGTEWRVAELRPGNRPLARLAEALLSQPDGALEDVYRPGETNRKKNLSTELRQGPLALRELLQAWPLPRNANLLVLVDQFEEIFRYYAQGDPYEAEAFVALLLASIPVVSQESSDDILSTGKGDIYVVITMRSDFLGECALFQGLPEAINRGLFLTPRLSRGDLREAIAMPARVFGAEVEPALVNQLLRDMGNDPDQLPLMQHLLMRLWDKEINHEPVIPANPGIQEKKAGEAKNILTLEQSRKIGGLSEALSQHANEAYYICP